MFSIHKITNHGVIRTGPVSVPSAAYMLMVYRLIRRFSWSHEPPHILEANVSSSYEWKGQFRLARIELS